MDLFNKNNKFRFLYFFFIAVLISEARKTQEMCDRYIKQACNTKSSRQLRSLLHIVNGRSAKAREYPHVALIGAHDENSEIEWYCGGSLISENFVMTAAHCAIVNPVVIRLGELNWRSIMYNTKPVDYNITEIIVHPHFNRRTLNNDIALFKFQGVSTFTDYIRPICLNANENIPKQKYIAIGWGASKYYGDYVPMLQSVELDSQNDDICYEVYKKTGYNAGTMLCVGYAPGGKDTCTGDSGGPLQIINENVECSRMPIYTQIGIISSGKNCALPNTPAKYTKVSNFIPWIESIVWK